MSIAEKLITIAENEQRVYEKGKQDQNKQFFDNLITQKNAQYYTHAFSFWVADMFYPTKDITPKASCQYMFYFFGEMDLVERLKECGVKLDFSNVTDNANHDRLYNTFAFSKITRIGEINVSNTSLSCTFYDCKNLKTIDKVIVSEITRFNSDWFGCTALENITFEGTIAYGLAFAQSTKLTKSSIENIFSCLSDTTSSKTLTLSKTAVNNAFETASGMADGSTSEEWLNLVATKPNWTISLS
jgi:hypothetical protein